MKKQYHKLHLNEKRFSRLTKLNYDPSTKILNDGYEIREVKNRTQVLKSVNLLKIIALKFKLLRVGIIKLSLASPIPMISACSGWNLRIKTEFGVTSISFDGVNKLSVIKSAAHCWNWIIINGILKQLGIELVSQIDSTLYLLKFKIKDATS